MYPSGSPVLWGADWCHPAVQIAALTALSFAWNAFDQLSWQPPLFSIVDYPAFPILLISAYARWRNFPRVSEAALYLFLWIVFSFISVRLTYLAADSGLPLRDSWFAQADGAIGFNWLSWARLVSQVVPQRVEAWIYGSYFWQPVISVCFFAAVAPGRNHRLLTSAACAALVTVVVSALFPALGPGHALGMVAPWEGPVMALRAGSHGPFPYIGIVLFPSFHAALAILMTLAHRGLRTFPFFAILNGTMLLTIPFAGDHYLADILAGAIVAAGASAFSACVLPASSATRNFREDREDGTAAQLPEIRGL